jgi:hypothetical protein
MFASILPAWNGELATSWQQVGESSATSDVLGFFNHDNKEQSLVELLRLLPLVIDCFCLVDCTL